MASASPTTDATTDGFPTARKENGCFTNSFNPEFKMPNYATILRWVFRAPNMTNLPPNTEDLDKELPVIKHTKSEIFTEPSGLHFIWIGHATCLVQMDDFVFITDPIFSERCSMTPNMGPKRFRPPALQVDDLPNNLQAVVISHNHYDHLDLDSVQRLQTRYGDALTWYCGLGGRQWFLDCHIKNVVELNWGEDQKHPVRRSITTTHLLHSLCI